MGAPPIQLIVPPEAAGLRLDSWLAATVEALSRARIQALIAAGDVTVDGDRARKNRSLRAGESICVRIPEPVAVELRPQDLPLDVLYEDEALVVVNKAPGMVVHPAAGHPDGTLVNALLHHCPDLGPIGGELRPGIVHRLDKDTSGAIVIAKSESAMQALTEQFKERTVQKRYHALVWGQPDPAQGRIETLIGRSAADRKKMSVQSRHGRQACSRYTLAESLGPASLLEVEIETGRTHQIRVHLTHIAHPIVGDPVYGRQSGRPELPRPATRQMLHASRIAFAHPADGRYMELHAELPGDMHELLEALRAAT